MYFERFFSTDALWIYQISYLYYGVVAIASCIIVALPVSFLTGEYAIHKRKCLICRHIQQPLVFIQKTGVDIHDIVLTNHRLRCTSLANLRGRQGRSPVQFLSFHAVFGKKIPNNKLVSPPWGLALHRLGNPGSTTVLDT